MKLLRVKIVSAATCGGLLDGLDVHLRSPLSIHDGFAPLCLVGPNGSGKSQFMQVIAEIFQSVIASVASSEERAEGNPDLQFEVEYLVRSTGGDDAVHVRATRRSLRKKGKPQLTLEAKVDGSWIRVEQASEFAHSIIPTKVIGYTSGENETLSLPFLLSRSGYASEVATSALRAMSAPTSSPPIPDTRLMLIDYGTHLEVLVANLLLGSEPQRRALLQQARLRDLHSLRCVIQLNHRMAPKSAGARAKGRRPGIQLTEELESYIDALQRCATDYHHDKKTDTYVLNFYVNAGMRRAFREVWPNALDLYSALHKLAMLNDLAIPKSTRERFKRDTKRRRFASRLPEPQDEDKVFRFEQVNFVSADDEGIVDYVSLSDGEHQLTQLLGTLCMISFENVLFLLDEPESHFNPQWRVELVSKLLALPTASGSRSDRICPAARQECLLTTHAPFVVSDTQRERVFIFTKDVNLGTVSVAPPNIETYGTPFDAILEECFNVRPPISDKSLSEIRRLRRSTDPTEVRAGIQRIGSSVQKAFLIEHLRRLES